MATSFAPELPVEGKTVKALTSLAAKRTRELFAGNFGESLPLDVQRWVATAQQTQTQQMSTQPTLSQQFAGFPAIDLPIPSKHTC